MVQIREWQPSNHNKERFSRESSCSSIRQGTIWGSTCICKMMGPRIDREGIGLPWPPKHSMSLSLKKLSALEACRRRHIDLHSNTSQLGSHICEDIRRHICRDSTTCLKNICICCRLAQRGRRVRPCWVLLMMFLQHGFSRCACHI